VLKEVCRAGCLQGFVAGASTNENTDSSCRGVPALCADANTVRNGSHLHRSFILEWLRDLSERKVTEILHHGGLGELKEALLLLNAVVTSLVSLAEV
jgi:hypothetical protein